MMLTATPRLAVLLGLWTLFSVSAAAAAHAVTGTVYLSGGTIALSPGEVEGGTLIHPAWLPEEKRPNALTATTEKFGEGEGWRNFSFSFVPAASGEINFTLFGGATCKPDYFQEAPNECWIAWADLRAEGAELPNGDFSERDARGNAAHWITNGQQPEPVEAEGGKPSFAMPVSPQKQCSQKIRVEAGVKVRISGKCRFWRCVAPGGNP